MQIPAAVGCLHVICWARLRSAAPDGAAFPVARGLVVAGCVAIGLFLVLCANEIFGNPPFMTAPLNPGSNLAGTWTSANASLTITAN